MMVRYGGSLLFKMVEIVTSRKPICNFLLVVRYNYNTYLLPFPFQDITIYWSKMYSFSAFLPNPFSLVWSRRSGCFPETHGMKISLKT